MEATVLFQEVYETIMSGEAFDAVAISCDRKRGTGGKLLRLEGWVKCGEDVGRELAVGHKETINDQQTKTNNSKDPHHAENGTVNVFNPANSGVHPISLHWDLIRFFNGKRVIN